MLSVSPLLLAQLQPPPACCCPDAQLVSPHCGVRKGNIWASTQVAVEYQDVDAVPSGAAQVQVQPIMSVVGMEATS